MSPMLTAMMAEISSAKPTRWTTRSFSGARRRPPRANSNNTNVMRPPSSAGMGSRLMMARLIDSRPVHMMSGRMPALATTTIFVVALIPLLPVYARDVLDVGSSGFGILGSALGVGFLIGSIVISMAGDIPKKAVVLLIAGAFWDGPMIAFAFSRIFVLSVALVFVMGIGAAIWVNLTGDAASDVLKRRDARTGHGPAIDSEPDGSPRHDPRRGAGLSGQ